MSFIFGKSQKNENERARVFSFPLLCYAMYCQSSISASKHSVYNVCVCWLFTFDPSDERKSSSRGAFDKKKKGKKVQEKVVIF